MPVPRLTVDPDPLQEGLAAAGGARTLTRRRVLARGAGALLAGSGLLGAGRPALARASLAVAYTAVPDFAGIFIAKERGYFEQRGLDVTLQQLPLTSNVPPALVSGSVQIGGTTPPVLLQAVDSGLDLVTVGTGSVYDNSRGYVGIVTRPAAAIGGPKDLVGKRVGVPGLGGTLHVLARRWLADKGVDAKQVQFVEVPLPQMPTVLQGGTIDAAVTGEPFIGRIVAAGTGVVLPGFSSDLPNGFATVCYAATRSWATGHAAELAAFRQAIGDAITFATAHRDDAYVDLGKYFKVPEPVLRATPWPQLARDAEEAHLSFWSQALADQSMLKKPAVTAGLLLK